MSVAAALICLKISSASASASASLFTSWLCPSSAVVWAASSASGYSSTFAYAFSTGFEAAFFTGVADLFVADFFYPSLTSSTVFPALS